MKRILTYLASLAIVTSALAADIGKPAPAFTATDINGNVIKLSDYAGKIVVLESYNLDCPFCANHFKTGAMQALQKEATSKGVIWLLVNSVNSTHPSHRSTDAAKKEFADEKINATAWVDDSSGKIGREYDMKTTPDMFIINKDGVLVYQGAIDDTATPDHDPNTAKNYVRLALAELWAGKPVTINETKSYGCSVKY
jgi:alkyl hydroperoxide reductase subunit AhpC